MAPSLPLKTAEKSTGNSGNEVVDLTLDPDSEAPKKASKCTKKRAAEHMPVEAIPVEATAPAVKNTMQPAKRFKRSGTTPKVSEDGLELDDGDEKILAPHDSQAGEIEAEAGEKATQKERLKKEPLRVDSPHRPQRSIAARVRIQRTLTGWSYNAKKKRFSTKSKGAASCNHTF